MSPTSTSPDQEWMPPTAPSNPAFWNAGNVVLAGAFLLLLIDGAVETFVAGAPVRWIVAGTVAVYLALTVLLRRKLTLEASAWASLFVLLGLLAFTVWRPGGMSAGVVLLRQPTSTVLAAVTALAIALAGWALLRSKFIPVAAKVAVGLVAFYGVAAVVWGIVARTPYSDLFRGQSLWTRLPFWLQGAVVGGLVLLPAGALLHAVAAMTRRPGTPRRVGAAGTAALGLVAAIAVAGLMAPAASGGRNFWRSNASGDSGSTLRDEGLPQPPLAQISVTADELMRMLKAYQKLPEIIDRSSFDVKARAKTLKDVRAAFEFVRDRIANEVYPGVLRGAGGTLSASAGNDLDKALLLGALLAGQKNVRYARCTLDDGLANERVRAMFAAPSRLDRSDVSQALLAGLAEQGISERRSAELGAALKAGHAALDRAVVQTAQHDLTIVRDALTRAGIHPRPHADHAVLLAEAREHHWLQVEEGGGWQDLDPAFASAQPGQTFCAATETRADLAPELYQTITFRVRNEFLEGGRRRSDVALEQKLAAAALHGQGIIFVNFAMPSEASLLGGGSAPSFAPVLFVGSSFFSGSEFRISGDTSGVREAFGGGELAGAEGGEGPTFAGQRLDFELTAPGRSSVTSRVIVDSGGANVGDGGTAPGPADLALLTAQLVQPHAIAVSTGALDRAQLIETAYAAIDMEAAGLVVTGRGAKSPDDIRRAAAILQSRVLEAYALLFASASDRTMTSLWNAAYPKVRIFRDQPLVAIADLSLRRSADGEKLVAGLSIDVRHNVVRVAAETPQQSEQAFWMNAHHGLVDGALERYLLWFPTLQVADRSATGRVPDAISTSTVFQLAGQEGVSVQASVGQDAVRLLEQTFARTGGNRLASEVTEHTAVVLPAGPVRVKQEDRLGLWAIDLDTGHLVALLDTGLRGDTSEYAYLNKQERTYANAALNCLRSFGYTRACSQFVQDWTYYASRLLQYVDELEGPVKTVIIELGGA